jgi:formamidopyrimidine-DNA glycosylase
VPELPEVESARRSLARTVVGKRIARVEVLRPVAVRTHSARAFSRALAGETLAGVERRGKALWFRLKRWVLVFRYMLWGVVRFRRRAPEPDRGTTVLVTFSDGSALEFRELQLSTFHLVPAGREAEVADGGIEPLSPALTLAAFREALGRRGTVKDALCAQDRLAGIGNLWAHEILFEARLRPDRTVGSLTPGEVETLYRAVRETLRKAVRAGGEPDFEDALGRKGRYPLAVYGRAGQPCRVCGTAIVGTRLHGRPSFFCPSCQR